MRLLILVLISICLTGSIAFAQTRSVADLASHRGTDREEMLKAGAKKEGKMVWYTSLTAHRDIANVFEAKYPASKSKPIAPGPTMSHEDCSARLRANATSPT